MDPFRNCAAGVVSSAKLFRPEDFAELTTITASRYRARASRPSAAPSVASRLLVDAAATPPLRGGEYSTFNISSFIHTFYDRRQSNNFRDRRRSFSKAARYCACASRTASTSSTPTDVRLIYIGRSYD